MSDKRYRTCEHTTKVRWRLYRCQRCDKRKRHVACEDCHGVFCETCGRPNKRGKKERLSEVAKIVAEAKHRLGVDCGCDECLQKRFPVAMDQIIKDAYALAKLRHSAWQSALCVPGHRSPPSWSRYSWTRDKSDLPEGEWMREVDKAQWRDAETGLACLVVRNHVGCWCGYVGVTSEHPWWQCSYDDCDVDVHGGLTYAGWGGGGPEESRVIRYAPLEDDPVEVVKERLGISSLWWFGFDCAHSGDLCPRMTRVYQQTGVYRTFAYVVDEVTILAKQVKNNAKMST